MNSVRTRRKTRISTMTVCKTYRLINYTTGEVYESTCEVPVYALKFLYHRACGQYRESMGTYRLVLLNATTGKVIAEWH